MPTRQVRLRYELACGERYFFISGQAKIDVACPNVCRRHREKVQAASIIEQLIDSFKGIN
jgi:hypothetical protein